MEAQRDGAAGIFGGILKFGAKFVNTTVRLIAGGSGTIYSNAAIDEAIDREMSTTFNANVDSTNYQVGSGGMQLGLTLVTAAHSSRSPKSEPAMPPVNKTEPPVLPTPNPLPQAPAPVPITAPTATATPTLPPGNGFTIWTHPERALPSYTNGGPTSGVMVPLNPPGLPVYLNSGPKTGARFPFSQADGHLETNAALEMGRRGISEANVFHNNPKGTCGNCDYYIPTFLRPGSTMHVSPPSGSVAPTPRWIPVPKTYNGNSGSPYP